MRLGKWFRSIGSTYSRDFLDGFFGIKQNRMDVISTAQSHLRNRGWTRNSDDDEPFLVVYTRESMKLIRDLSQEHRVSGRSFELAVDGALNE